jgi:hypothetical protein
MLDISKYRAMLRMSLAVLEVVSLSWEIVGYCSSFWRKKSKLFMYKLGMQMQL